MPLRWFYFSQFGTLGNGLPTAIAAQVAHPDHRVALMAGDGGFGFTAMEFDTAVRHNLPIVAVLGNDATWGIDYHIQVGLIWSRHGDEACCIRGTTRWWRGWGASAST